VLFGRAGVSDERELEFERIAGELGIRDDVLLTGVVSEHSLRELYHRAVIFVFPSLYEGFGYPVLEAMAAGACVVVRPASSMAEVLGDAGAYVETSDPAALASLLETLLAETSRRRLLGEAALTRAAMFTSERMARETMNVYERVLQKTMIEKRAR
jgi:glycosyltransferase involved in cell wall biosynthesis